MHGPRVKKAINYILYLPIRKNEKKKRQFEISNSRSGEREIEGERKWQAVMVKP